MSLPHRKEPDGSYGVAMRGDVLREQMQLRGLTSADLARLAGAEMPFKKTSLSPATISHALAGRRLHPRTFRAIAAALAKVEPVPGSDVLAAIEAGTGRGAA